MKQINEPKKPKHNLELKKTTLADFFHKNLDSKDFETLLVDREQDVPVERNLIEPEI